MEKRFKFIIVGHVDHGKSTLIGRLLYDTDSLPDRKIEEIRRICETTGKELEFAYVVDHLEEEREQNITIDTAQIFFNTKKRNYTIIDAPGHKEFMKNMITGVSQAEAAMLVVDAMEGIQEQTKRHAYVLHMLNLDQVIVVINKMDMADYDEGKFKKLKEELTNFLANIKINPIYVIPISSRDGDNIVGKSENMLWYDGSTVLEALDMFKSKENKNKQPLRMLVQDTYKINDKRIIVGRVESGTIKEGQNICFLPNNDRSVILSVEEFMNQGKKEAVAGESTGVVIKDKLFVDRGQVICTEENQPKITNEIKGNIFWMEKNNFNKGETVTIKCGTQEMFCTLKKIEKRINSSSLQLLEEDAQYLGEREVGEVILVTEKPLAVDDFNQNPELGRFVIERDGNIVAGGIVTLK